jgi:hypothetical protein
MARSVNGAMTGFLGRYRSVILSSLLSIFVGAFLFFYSDKPPYGQPYAELSMNYWGWIVDIAHKWRSLDFLSFWDRGLGGGVSLFTSGVYPFLNPTNALAWLLNDEQFYMFKLAEPYMLGGFSMCLLLLRFFRLPWFYAFFGALYFLGMGYSRHSIMAESPIFLEGIFMFPVMVFLFLNFYERNMYFAVACVGAAVAVQFAVAGVIQLPQVLIWWLIFLSVFFMLSFQGATTLKRWFFACLIFVVMAAGFAGVQFIPTLYFSLTESARIEGQYALNNFPIYLPGVPHTLGAMLWEAVFFPGGNSMKGIIALFFVALGLWAYFGRQIAGRMPHRRFVLALWLATVIYVTAPSVLSILAAFFPVLGKIFSPLTKFTFKYGVHIIDFNAALTLCLIMAQEFRFPWKAQWDLRKWTAVLCFLAAFLFLAIPLVVSLPVFDGLSQTRFVYLFRVCFNTTTWFVAGLTGIIIYYILFRPSRMTVITAVALFVLGFMTMITCYNWNDKGRRTAVEKYLIGTPEHNYYRSAAGQFYLPYHEPEPMIHNYNLLFGVHGVSGNLPLGPYRLFKFLAHYHSQRPQDLAFWPVQNVHVLAPSEGLISYFPVDFTTVNRGAELPWGGFVRKVEGQEFDIWVRQDPAPQVLFARQVRIAGFDDIIRQFDRPFDGTILVAPEDARAHQVRETSLPPARVSYSDFRRGRSADYLRTRISAAGETFVMIPEMFRKGWQVFADGKRVDVFPAQYLFVGFKLAAGEHEIRARFVPPLLVWGLIINLLSILLLWYLYTTQNHKSKEFHTHG